MARFDASNAECLVYTWKEGVLSAVAHDLRLRVTSFTVEVDDATRAVTARFDPASLRVVCAMKHGADAPDALSEKDRREIEENLRDDVLEVKRHREISFRSRSVRADGSAFLVEGDLTMHGRTRAVSARLAPSGGRLATRVRLHQPDWDVKPYKAMLGALKVQPDVEVTLSIPWDG